MKYIQALIFWDKFDDDQDEYLMPKSMKLSLILAVKDISTFYKNHEFWKNQKSPCHFLECIFALFMLVFMTKIWSQALDWYWQRRQFLSPIKDFRIL